MSASEDFGTGDHDGGEAGPERTFAALPPARGRGFAGTWWGRAWLKALEDTALDTGQLAIGRRYARLGAVGAVSVRPGRITAVVRDRDHTPHRSDVLVTELSGADWDRLLGMVADRAGHLAALLDRDMPPQLVEDAAAAGVELLPGIGDLEPECDCDAWDHCMHTTALCYQVARLLDEDPFVLLLMRGRGERRLLQEVQELSAVRAARDAAPARERGGPEAAASGGGPVPDAVPAGAAPDGVAAAEAFAAREILPPLPEPPPRVAEPGLPPVLGGGTEPAPGVDVTALEFLAADAAARARLLLSDALAPGHEKRPVPPVLTVGEDAVRLAAARPGDRITARLATGSGRDRTGLALAVRAWEQGGTAALAVLEEEWTPGPELLARAREQLARWADETDGAAGGTGGAPALRPAGNRWTAAGVPAQLRLGRDGRWWPYRRDGSRWSPAGPAAGDPAAAMAAMAETAVMATTAPGPGGVSGD
ncbi:SWIM zinc finger family protein [Streptomyces lycii]|uniref:SWF or SNF family helicase n=1 Tax=Streptomyces lycii TaxID=2654337 RepID=A0ABQ7FN96_9ACTN|nr:SWF or SNF family helicase [Streptomyces lycii]KAF4409880.1 SWF or SNF family helicase [Streptomyces lycii]